MRRNNDIFDETVDGGVFNAIMRAVGGDRLYVRGPLWASVIIGLTVAVLAAVIWYSYPRQAMRQGQDVPVIRADATPYRSAPDDPGGMDVPHRDSTVFETLREGSNTKGLVIENLLEDSEQPMKRAELFQKDEKTAQEEDGAVQGAASQDTASRDAQVASSGDRGEGAAAAGPEAAPMESPVDISEDSAGPASAPVSTPVGDKKAAEPLKTAQAAPDIKPEEKPAPVKAKTEPQAKPAGQTESAIAPAAGGTVAASGIKAGYFAQIASLPTKTAVDGEWKKLKRQFSGSLSGLGYRVQQADLGAKGTYYRIQVGPMAKEKASALCAEVKKSRPGGCLVVSH